MAKVTQISSKWLVIFLFFSDKYKEDNGKDLSSIEKEIGSWKSSIRNLVLSDESSINIICATTRVSAYFKESETHLETKFVVKENNQLLKFRKNSIGIKFAVNVGYITDFAENIRRIDEYYTGENRIVITLGHGSVFGINTVLRSVFEKKIRDQKRFADVRNPKTRESSSTLHKLKFNTTYNDGTYYLSNAEMAQTFKDKFKANGKPKPVDILVMSDCFMQNIFSQFDFHEAVDFFVAPISGISFPGYNISAAISNLQSNPSIKEAADFFVKKQTVESHRLYKLPYMNDIMDRWFVQSYKLDTNFQLQFKLKFDTLLAEINQIAEDNTLILEFIQTTLRDCYKYSELSLESLDMFDFQVFIKGLKLTLYLKNSGRINDEVLINLIDDLVMLLSTQKFNYYIGANFLHDKGSFLDSREDFNALYDSGDLANIGFGFYLPFSRTSDPKFFEFLKNKNFSPLLIRNSKYLDLIDKMTNLE